MLRSDKFHDECGVVAIYAHPEAEMLAYLGLHALQHRGQESAGIVTSNNLTLSAHRAMGLVADIFTEEVLSQVHGSLAIGHTRYSTAGDSALFNAQPIMVQSNKGMIALAHNGNLVNAQEIRHRLEAQGSIFQTNSDTEVIVHLIALSKEQTLPDAIVFASETCAFDLIGATYEREVKPGELVIVGPEGITSRFYAPVAAQSSCIFEHVYFSRPDSMVFGRPVQVSREGLGRQLAREAPAEADLVVPVPDFGVTLKLNPVRTLLEGKRVVLIDDSIVRGTTSRKIVRMIRNAGAKEVH